MVDYIIRTQSINYKYEDGTQALKGLDLEILKGSTTVFLGSNGAGKSTLFLALNGILKPQSGTLFYNNKPYDYSKKGLMNLKRNVGIVFQDPDDQLFSSSVIQDISFGAFNLGFSQDVVKKKVDEAMKNTDIYHLKDKPTHMLSFGQKKRVAIAGVLVMEPSVIILDEPTAGLDPKGIREIMGLLTELKERLGLTVIMATHDIDLVPEYADYVYVIDKGKHIIDGTVDSVFSKGDILRSVDLNVPRFTQLFEKLKREDGIFFQCYAHTVLKAYTLIREKLKS